MYKLYQLAKAGYYLTYLNVTSISILTVPAYVRVRDV